jgi:hypothetical protein
VPLPVFLAALVAGLAILVLIIVRGGGSASSEPYVAGSCAQLNGRYPDGVGKYDGRDYPSQGVGDEPLWRVDTATYEANKQLDADGDGVACEPS